MLFVRQVTTDLVRGPVHKGQSQKWRFLEEKLLVSYIFLFCTMKNSWMSRQYWMQNLNKTGYSAFLFEFFISVRNQKICIQLGGVKWPLYMPCIENLIVLNKFNILTLPQSLTEKMRITQRIMGMPRALGQLGNRLGTTQVQISI